jgi:hypothetical protein
LFIPDPGPDFLPIPDPGVKKAPDPGSLTGFATQKTFRIDYQGEKLLKLNSKVRNFYNRIETFRIKYSCEKLEA